MVKHNIFRTALVWGLHTAVKFNQFSLDQPHIDNLEGNADIGVLGFPSLLTWNEISSSECRVSIWLNYDREKHPQINMKESCGETHLGTMPNVKQSSLNRCVGLCATGWLQRQSGLYIQGSGGEWITDTFARKREREFLTSISIPLDSAFDPEQYSEDA